MRYSIRKNVFQNKRKKKLKGKNISIKENVTGYRMSALNEAREKFDFKNVWTYNGRILYKGNNDEQKIKVFCEENIFQGFKALMVTIKMKEKNRLSFCFVLFCFCFLFLFFLFFWFKFFIVSLRGSEYRIFISERFHAFGNASLMFKIINIYNCNTESLQLLTII